MGARIFLRTNGENSRFKVCLNRLICSAHGDSLLLCSGYISDIPLIQKDIVESIKIGCAPSGTVTLVAGKFSQSTGNKFAIDWEAKFKKFASFLKEELSSTGIHLKVMMAPNRNWHAKIALKINGTTPVIALLGSSNLTGPAYMTGIDAWNYESDTLLWDEDIVGPGILHSTASSDEVELDMIVRPGSIRTEKSEMNKLYKIIMGLTLEDVTDDKK
ncbi:hypothetical protein M1M11_08275 [Pseudomonas azerbaijanoccidens]|uniref:hypothetical protein n=1 Tax=Pseudomonas azerbaijanoccidentalis TaxID=2842347 RepID=UPI00200A89B9|nr:hypothetical protein [Pseudomonas azerbaijanoccidentalis]MCK8664879.1 hypothetical protein [Pseudomonas azerbaijanoccidentalis]